MIRHSVSERKQSPTPSLGRTVMPFTKAGKSCTSKEKCIYQSYGCIRTLRLILFDKSVVHLYKNEAVNCWSGAFLHRLLDLGLNLGAAGGDTNH